MKWMPQSPAPDGAITLGDSHEYGLCVDVFDKTEIDELILREAATFLRVPDWRIAEHWHGCIACIPRGPVFPQSQRREFAS